MVPVIITNCHVSKYWKIGPVIAQTSRPRRDHEVSARPAAWDVRLAISPKSFPGR